MGKFATFFEAAEKRSGTVHVAVLMDGDPESAKGKYAVSHKPDPKSARGRTKSKIVAQFHTPEEAEKHKQEYAAKHGLRAIKKLGEAETLEETKEDNNG